MRSTRKHLCWRFLPSLGHALEEAEHGARVTERGLLALFCIWRVEQRRARDAPAVWHRPGNGAARRKVFLAQSGERDPHQGWGVEAVVVGCRRQKQLGRRQVMGQDRIFPRGERAVPPRAASSGNAPGSVCHERAPARRDRWQPA